MTYVVLLGVLVSGGLLLAQALLARRDHRGAGLLADGPPAEGITADVGVRCVPPAGISPGEAGVLLRRRTTPADVRATLIDLAARGYVHIEESDGDRTLTVGRPAGTELRRHERALLAALFPDTETVRVSTSERLLTQVVTDVEAALARSVVDRGWFRRISAGRFPAGMALFVLAFAAILGTPVLGVLALALEAAGIDDNRTFGALLLLSVPAVTALFLRRRKGRLPAGYAAHHQVLGFKRYLETAGPAAAERDLPWAVAFGLVGGGASLGWHGVESWL